MTEWKEYKLGEICTELSDGLHKAPIFNERGDYIFVNAKNLSNGYIVDNDPERKSTYEEYLKYSSPLNDTTILYSIDGTIGNIALYRGEKCILGKGACYINPNPSIIDRLYLYYELQSPRFMAYIDRMSTGSTIQHISLKTMRNYTFTSPSLKEQRRISAILSSLDDKIDLLHRENATLEQMAETLFRQWFVVEAKEEWEEVQFADAIEVFDYLRRPLSKMERDKMKNGEQLYPYYGAAEIMDYIDSYLFDGEYILMGEDGTVKTDDGYPILQYATGKFWPNNHAHVLQAKSPYNNCFIWNYLKTTNIESIVTGAVQPKINQANLLSLPFYKYPIKLVEMYMRITDDWWSKIMMNNKQIQALIQTRDGLLPKLMGGEIKI